MATTFKEEYFKALETRGLALTAKRNAIQIKEAAEKRKNDLEKILFGDNDSHGIVYALSIFYKQIMLMSGKETTKPLLSDLATAKSQYQSNFSLSVSVAGDGVGGLHPPQIDNPNAGQDDVNKASLWITNFALENSPSKQGVMPLLDNLTNIIGSEAVNANNRGSYETEELAQEQANLDKGIGILGERTENSEVYAVGSSSNSYWTIGKNGIDTPDNFSQKANLITAFNLIKDKLISLSEVLDQEVILLGGEKNTIFQEFKIELPVDPELANFITTIQDFTDHIQVYINYFDQFADSSPSAKRTEINAKLIDALNYSAIIATALNNRIDSITSGMLGNASSGLIKSLNFWVSEIVAKSDGPYAMVFAANDMLSQALTNIDDKNNRLLFFTSDYKEWVETPLIQSIYDRAVLNLDQTTIKRWETDILWNMVLSANKYLLLYKPLSRITLPLNNNPWKSASKLWVTEEAPSGFLKNSVTIAPPLENTLFRLIALDTSQGDVGKFERMDAFDTESLQSDIISDLINFTQLNNDNERSVIQIDPSVNLKERDFLWVNDSKIAQIMAVTDNQYALDLDYGVITHIQKLFGLYYNSRTNFIKIKAKYDGHFKYDGNAKYDGTGNFYMPDSSGMENIKILKNYSINDGEF